MATAYRNFFGFETLDRLDLATFSGALAVVGSGRKPARTGRCYLECLEGGATRVDANDPDLQTSSTSAGIVQCRARFYIRLVAYPSTSGQMLFGSWSLSAYRPTVELDTAGHVRVRSWDNGVGVYSSQAIPIDNQWHKVEFFADVTNLTIDGLAYHMSSASVTIDDAFTAEVNSGPFAGWVTAPFQMWELRGAGRVDFDDYYLLIRKNPGELDPPDLLYLPSQTRVSPVAATGPGSVSEWSGDWRNVLDHPRDTALATEQSSATAGQVMRFAHATNAALGLSSIKALKVYAEARAAVASTQALVIGETEVPVSVATAYSTTGQVGVVWAASGETLDATFDSTEFGFKNVTGTTVYLGTIIAEALHESEPTDLTARPGTTYRHVVGTYVGNGAFQAVTGVGFAPQILLIKKVGGPAKGGLFWQVWNGGSLGAVMDSTAQLVSTGVLTADADGFTLGPNSQVNESGTTYRYLAIRDGGAHPLGTFVEAGEYFGDALDNRTIPMRAGWTPAQLFVQRATSTPTALRTLEMTGDFSAPLSPTAPGANLVQAVGQGTFEVGSSTTVNASNSRHMYLAFRNASQLANGVASGTYVGTGAAQDISIAITPALLAVKPASTTDAYVRGPGDTGTTSRSWQSSSLTSTTAITALGTGQFSVGTTLSANGVTHYWVGWVEAYEIPLPPTGEAEPGLGESFGPLVWVEYATPPAGAIRAMAGVDLPDPATYYGGYKEPRLLRPGLVSRGLSDDHGQYQGAQFSVELHDTDRYFRTLLDQHKTLANRRLVMRMISEADWRQKLTPRTVAVGIVRTYRAEKGLAFRLDAEDYLALFTGLGSNDVLLPRRLITKQDFPDAPPDAIGKPVPIVYGAVSGAFSSAGPVTGLTVTEIGSALAQPTGLTLTAQQTGGQLAGGQVIYVRVAARHASGESDWTDPQSATVPSTPGGGGTAGLMCQRDTSLLPPTFFEAHHWAIGGAYTKYRWCFATALKNIGGVWHESDPSNWGDIHGDVDPNIAAIALFRVRGSPDRMRLYVFNLDNFHPTLRPDAPAGLGESTRICRMVEADVASPYTVYTPKTGGRVDADYAGAASNAGFGAEAAWGADGVEGTDDDLTHFLACYGDADAADYIAGAGGSGPGGGGTTQGSIQVSWTAASGATSYRVYWTDTSDWSGAIYYADVAGTSYTITALSGQAAATATRQATYMVTAIMSDGETAPSAELSITQTRLLRDVLLSWTPKDGALGYRVYRRQGSQDFDRRWDVSANPAGGAALRPFFVDDFEDSDATPVEGAPKPQGVLPLLYLGPATDLLGERWHRFLVAAHAVKEVVDLYQNGERVADSTYGTTFAVPGKAGWTSRFGPGYTDHNGARYTFVYARGAAGDAAAAGTQPLTANVLGIEATADGTGALITDLFEQYEHFLRNWVLRDYRTGAWATTGPTWGDTPNDIDIVDAASFAAAKSIAQARVPGGYVGAWVVGLDPSDAPARAGVQVSLAYKQETVRTWIARLNQSADCYCGFSRKSQFVVRMIDSDPDALASTPRYSAQLGINAQTFEIEDQPSTIENRIVARFKRGWASATWAGSLQYEDPDAQAAISEVRPYTLDLWCVRTPAHAADVAYRRLQRHKYGQRLVRWEADMGALTVDLGDLVRVSHPDGIGPQGWSDRPIFLTRHEFDPAQFVVRLEGWDVQDVYTPSIANVGFLPPVPDGAVDAVDALQRTTLVAAYAGTLVTSDDFDLAVRDAMPGQVEVPDWPADVAGDVADFSGDLHTTGP